MVVFKSFAFFRIPQLRFGLIFSGGRNSTGCLVNSGIGRRVNSVNYTYIDYFRSDSTSSICFRFDFDGFRNRYVLLLYSSRFGFSYILPPSGVKLGWLVHNNNGISSIGSSTLLRNISLGSLVSNISNSVNSPILFSRSCGAKAIVVYSNYKAIGCKLSSGLIRKFSVNALCVVGGVSRDFNQFRFKSKAGFAVNRGSKPRVRGVAKNPVDHPHGGGEGKKSPPTIHRSPWGWVFRRKKNI